MPAIELPSLNGKPNLIPHASLQEQAQAVLDRLAFCSMPASTSRALQSALRYWSAWHLAAFGEPLGLTLPKPVPVPAARVLVFIAHHAAVPLPPEECGMVTVETGMPAVLRETLLQSIPRIANRLVAGRNRSAMFIRGDVPAVKTVLQRVSLLGTLHERLGLPRPQSDQRIGRALTHLRKATARTVPAALPHSKRALRLDDVQAMLDACGEDIRCGGRSQWIATRDRALLLAGFGSGRRRAEIARMHVEHLQVGMVRLANGKQARCIWWHLYELKGRVSERGDTPLLSLPLVGPARVALTEWLHLLTIAGIERGAVWRSIRPGKSLRNVKILVSKPMPPEAITLMVKRRMENVMRKQLIDWKEEDYAELENHIRCYISSIGAHSLRSGFVTSSLDIGLRPDDIAKITAHSDPRSFRIYDQRGVEGNPAINVVNKLKLR